MMMTYIMPMTAKAVTYNSYEVGQLRNFLEQPSERLGEKNGDVLYGVLYKKDDPSTWRGITWNSSGRVTEIDLYGLVGHVSAAGDLNLSNFSSLTAVNIFWCHGITGLNVYGDTALREINMESSGVTELNLTTNTALTTLDCSTYKLTSLDVSKNTKLTTLDCYYNKLTSLDLSKNTALTNLNCANNDIASLDLRQNINLKNINCGSNKLTSLDLSKNKLLEVLTCYYNKIKTLDLRNNTKLKEVTCFDNELTTLNVSGLEDLEEVQCQNNKLKTLDASSSPLINRFQCANNNLTQITANINGADISVEAVGNGYVELFKFMDNLYATAKERTPAKFINWTRDSTQVSTDAKYDLTLGTDYDIKANFALTVTFDTDGGSDIASQTVDIGDKVTKPSDPTKSGYVFKGWYKESALTNAWDFGTDTVSGDTTLYAKWIEELKLTANPADAIIYKGKSVTITPNIEGGTWEFDSDYLTREGNKFTASKIGTTKVTYKVDGQSKEVDVTIDQYSITFNSNGGSSVDPQELDPDEKITEPSDPTKDGNVFEGWFREEALTNAWDFDSGVSGDTTLYAKWVKDLKLTLDPSDGIIYKGQDITITPNVEGGTWEIDSDYLTRDGNKFTALKAGETKVKYTFLSQSKEVDVTISKYSVDFDTDDGSAVESQKLDPDEKIVKPSDPTKEGYVFEGWFKENTFENSWDFDVDTVNEDTTLYAKWVEVLELTLDPSDGIIYKGQDITITPNVEGGTWEIDSDYLTRDGNKFTALKAGETKVKYTYLSQSKEADVTISKYSVDFNSDDGSAVDSQKLDPDEKIVKPSDPTKEGYVFEGWFKEAELTNAWDFDTDTVNEDTTIYAKWVEVLELTLDPSDGIIYKGQDITITPNVEGGTWEYDTDYLSQDGNTFTALKVGTTKVKYTFLSQSKEVDVTISKYSIDFDADGGSAVESQKLDPDEKIAKPSDPTKEGYVFEGWFKEAELTNAWDFDADTVSGDTILYAKWVKVLEFSDPKKDIDVGDTTTITPNVPGGTWEYDESYFKRDGNKFTALKSGTVCIKYTVGSQTICIYITITVKDNLPKTGEDFSLWLIIGAILLLAGVGLGIYSHKKKA